MNYSDFLKVDTSSEAKGALYEIEIICNENFSDPDLGKQLIGEILELFHTCLKIDNKKFLENIFFENQKTLRLTYDHQDFVFGQWDSFKLEGKPTSRLQQMQLVNLYRNIVSDLFDPYLTIIVACLKFSEGKFRSFTHSNLFAGEFHKVNFAQARMKGTALFNGYVPMIRNAVAHSGTHSIIYQAEHVVFRKIERKDVPLIRDFMKVGNDQLITYIASLINFVTAIYGAINIFGVDIQQMIASDRKLSILFINQVADKKSILSIRENRDKQYAQTWENTSMSDAEKRDYFARKFVESCKSSQLPATNLIFKKKEGMLLIEIPAKTIDIDNQKQVIGRLTDLMKYALIAERLFHFRYSSFFIIELEENNINNTFQLLLGQEELKAYDLHEADLYNLLANAKIYRNKIDFNIEVDFKALEKLQMLSFDPVSKRI